MCVIVKIEHDQIDIINEGSNLGPMSNSTAPVKMMICVHF